MIILDVILVSYNYFWVIVSIWYIHVLQYLEFRPCYPKLRKNTNVNKKIKKFFFLNYFTIILLE